MRAARAWVPAAIWAAFLLWLGSRPLGTGGTAGLDKVAHFLAYGVLGLLAGRGWQRSSPGPHPGLVVAAAAAVGLLDELNQMRVPARSADPFDVVADVLGVICGFALVHGMAARERTKAGE